MIAGVKWALKFKFICRSQHHAHFLLLQISSMLLFVKCYKQEVLGVGEVALPGEGGALREAAIQRRAKEASDGKAAPEHQDHESTQSNTTSISSTNGTDNSGTTDYVSTLFP